MVWTQLFYFVFTGCFFGACFTYENLDIVTLLPSSGLDEVKGQAQQEAIRLATEDFLKEKGLSNATTLGFHFCFHRHSGMFGKFVLIPERSTFCQIILRIIYS